MRKTDELYDGADGPFYAVHLNGLPYAKFSGTNGALSYWRGLDDIGRSYFHIENAKGERVELKDNPRSPGHAHAVLDTLNRNAR